MKKFFLFTLISGLAFLTLAASKNLNPSGMSKKACKLKSEGNFKEAFELFRELALEKQQEPDLVGGDFLAALQCLRSLNRISEIDAFREAVIKKHANNWQLLQSAAQSFLSGQHFGFMIAGEFKRGSHRGGGEYTTSNQRDRIRALQLYFQAMPLAMENVDNSQKASFFQNFAKAIMFNRSYSESWRLQYLSNLEILPDYEKGYGGRYRGGARGAPVDVDGNPNFYYMPKNFKDSKSDGERWRWLLGKAKEARPDIADVCDMEFSDFLLNQFGVQTMAHFGRSMDSGSKKGKSGPYAVDTLSENETIAKLATGIKRFKLPDEFNYIKIYKKIAASKLKGENALSNLSAIFMNRRQYPEAAEYLSKNIKEYGPGHRGSKLKQLNQIVGNWGKFEEGKPLPAGKNAVVWFRFRNAAEVNFSAHKINVKKLLDEIKAYLKDNPSMIKWGEVNLSGIGYRLVTRNELRFLEGKVAEWKHKLDPPKNHFDKRIEVETPLEEPGAYLIKAELADGNTSRIIVWLADTVIASKELDKGRLYYVADAVSGKPVSGAHLDFFGYKQEYIKKKRADGASRRRYNVLTKEFKDNVNDDGLLILNQPELDSSYSWLVTVRDGNGRFASLGFNRVWHRKRYDEEYRKRKIYCITDRPVYRPGQAVKFKFWVRYAKYDQSDISNFANMPFTVAIKSPKGDEVFKKTFTSDQFGGLNGEFAVSKNAALGQYQIYINRWRWDGNGHFRIEEYKKPEYEVKIEGPKEPAKLGDKITATITAKYYFGAPVTSAKVKYKVLRSSHSSVWYPPACWDWLYSPGYWWFAYDCAWLSGWRQWGCGKPSAWWIPPRRDPPELVMQNEVPISPDGTVKVVIDSAVAKAFYGDVDSRYEITAEVVDQSRRTIVGKGSFIAAREPFSLFCALFRGIIAFSASLYEGGRIFSGENILRPDNRKPVLSAIVFCC